MLIKHIEKILINKCNINKQTKIVLGFSGGADSTCLLDLFYQLGSDVVVAYFNHKLRPNSEEEAKHAELSASNYSYDFRLGEKDIQSIAKEAKMGIEETARLYRYEFLNDSAIETGASAVAVAHNADDQVETILMNLIRGTGLNGLTGMKHVSFSVHNRTIPIIRPLLDVWKEEIIAYCDENDLPFLIDETNIDRAYTRNHIRVDLIPRIEKINPNFKRGIIRMRQLLNDEHEFIRQQAETEYQAIFQEKWTGLNEVNIEIFRRIPKNIQSQVINVMLEDFFGPDRNITNHQINSIQRVLMGEISSNYSRLKPDLHVLVEGNVGYVYKDSEDLDKLDTLNLSGQERTINSKGVAYLNKTWIIRCDNLSIEEVGDSYRENPNNFVAFLNADVVGRDILIRKWKEGDRYAPLGLSGHTMKLTDFWINKQFPKRLRQNWPLICSHNNILWIPGFQPAYKARITDRTKNVLKLTVSKNK